MNTKEVQKTAAELLTRWEAAEQASINLKTQYAVVFEELEALEAQKKELGETLKRVLRTEGAPPKELGLKKDQKTYAWATGEMYEVTMQYKQKTPYYDPAKLPADILAKPGIVKDVNTEAVAMFEDDARVKKAFVAGEWLSPALSIRRRTK